MKKLSFAFISLAGLYWVLHLWGLVSLPVFADEAIYIRWTQLMIDDWQQYAFFPLNDGKTPLMMWLMVPFQLLFDNQLYAARFVSVLIGFGQLVMMYALLQKLSTRKSVHIFGSLMTVILPFWYTYHRMALTEALLGLAVTIMIYGVVLVTRASGKKQQLVSGQESVALGVLVFGVVIGLLAKIPAVLAFPGLYLLLTLTKNKNELVRKVVLVSVAIGLGATVVSLLAVHPAFSQLFARGSDFLYPLSEVLHGRWLSNVLRIPRYLYYFVWYMTLPAVIITVYGLFSRTVQQRVHTFFWAGMLVCLPIFIMGKVVHPRYFFPAVVFFTLALAISFEGIVVFFEKFEKRMLLRVGFALGIALLLANTVTQSLGFIVSAATKADTTPYVMEDSFQYLEGWSSGHGILETTALLRDTAQTSSVALATEGSFGTLPDGILMYLHRQSVEHIYVEGVGFPSVTFPENFVQRSQSFEHVWYVANEDRVKMNVSGFPEVARYCRPHDAPCLVIWDVSSVVHIDR